MMGDARHTWRWNWDAFALGVVSCCGWLAALAMLLWRPSIPVDAHWLRAAFSGLAPILVVVVRRPAAHDGWWRQPLALATVVVASLPAILPWVWPGQEAISLLLLPFYSPALAIGVAAGVVFTVIPMRAEHTNSWGRAAQVAALGFAAPIVLVVVVGIVAAWVSPPACPPQPPQRLGAGCVELFNVLFLALSAIMLALSALLGWAFVMLGARVGAWVRRLGISLREPSEMPYG